MSDRPMLLKYLRIAEFYLEASESAPMNLLAHAGVLLCNENFEYLVMHPTDPTMLHDPTHFTLKKELEQEHLCRHKMLTQCTESNLINRERL